MSTQQDSQQLCASAACCYSKASYVCTVQNPSSFLKELSLNLKTWRCDCSVLTSCTGPNINGSCQVGVMFCQISCDMQCMLHK